MNVSIVRKGLSRRLLLAACVSSWPALLLALPPVGRYRQINLISDVPGMAREIDPDLVNPWGVAAEPDGSVLVIADNGAGTLTRFPTHGPPLRDLRVPLPEGAAGTSAPTGVVFNPTTEFTISEGPRSEPSRYIVVTEDGTIAGWNPRLDSSSAVIAVDNSRAGSIYKGVALASTLTGSFLYVANFHAGLVEVFDGQFHFVRSFTDPALPAGFAPFNVQNIGGRLYVAFAMQDADRKDEVAGPGLGFVDIFDDAGALIRRLTSDGELNAPWGMALAPREFGRFGETLLVGNFGDGRINAFDHATGRFLGTLEDRSGGSLRISGLWGLIFRRDALAFAAGPAEESEGLFGLIRPVGPESGERTEP